MSSAASMASAIRFIGFKDRVSGVHRAPSWRRGARPFSRSLKSMPCGGRAMRTRRPSRFQRRAQSRAAASPGSSPSASTITSRTSRGRSSDAKARGRKRRPGGISSRLHRGKAGLDAFADHQHGARLGEAHCAAATRPEHHLLRIDWRLAVAVAGEKGAVNGDRRSGRAVRHERHHRGPDATRGMFQSGMEAQGGQRRKREPARAQIGLDGRSVGRSRCLPDRERRRAALQGVGVGFIVQSLRRGLRAMPIARPVVCHRPRA